MADDKYIAANGPSAHHQSKDAAIELIRKKVEAAYHSAPALEAEARPPQPQAARLSEHQHYAQVLVQSGRSLSEIHKAWHDYYQSLDDEQKHQVWREFYAAHGRSDHYDAYVEATARTVPEPTRRPIMPKAGRSRHIEKLRQRHASRRAPVTSRSHARRGLHSLGVGLAAGLIAVMIVLFGFFNERFIAPFIQPSRALTNAPLISDSTTVGPDPELIIPKINLEVPVIYNANTIDEATVQTALQSGVVHYADTPLPGQNGNLVIVGHSSNNIFNPGKYKFAFVLLNRLDTGDTFYLEKDGKRYTYQVYKKQIVDASDVSVLGPADKTATASLITCDPPGTSLHRLVVTGEQISPDPSANTQAPTSEKQTSQTKIIPGNAPTLWSRFWDWFSR